MRVRAGTRAALLPTDRPRWFKLLVRIDPVEIALVLHGFALVGADRVADRAWAAALVTLFALWRPAIDLARRRLPEREPSLYLVKGAGSLLLAMALVGVDGGTESPFFFWPLLILAWKALVVPVRALALLAGVAVAAYLAVVFAVPDLTAASLGRLLLLIAFCGVLVVGRFRLDHHRDRSEALLRLLADAFWHAPVGLVVVGSDPDRIYHTNETARTMGLASPLTGEQAGSLRKMADRAREEGEPVGPDLFVLHGEESTRYLRVLAAPHRLSQEETVVILCAEDVSSQVTVGEQRRRFLEFASHQLRTPLTPIVAYAQLLERGQLDQDQVPEATRAILKGAERLLRLFDRMAAVVRLQHEAPHELEELSMEELLDRHLRPIDPRLLDGVVVNGDPAVRIRCHPASVARALLELLDNSHRFGRPPATLSWETEDAQVVIRLRDAGEGPDTGEDSGALFADWGQALPADVMPRGMGTRLGLVQAHLLVSLSSGDLRFVREDGDWAFVLRIHSGVRDRSTVSF